jgi:two-component system, LytTR family, sensor kinase
VRKNSKTYWYCQVFGWSFYILINLVFFGLKNHSHVKDYLVYVFSLPAAIGITHAYRYIVLRFRVIALSIPVQLLTVIVSSIVMAVLFFALTTGLLMVFGLVKPLLSFVGVAELIINNAVPFCLWNIIYFGSKYFQNYKKAEINSLRILAASRESELNNLKAQLNPHFMFNSMNSIRALVDEDPAKAKEAITRLAGILRNTLLMNKSKLIPLAEEMNLVRDYLEMEQVRYEERLSYEFKIEEDVYSCLIPPFIIQSQVENAIKHGISKYPGKGKIMVAAFRREGSLRISVSNTGKLNADKPLTGVGFANSIHRLELLYNKEGRIRISEAGNLVIVDIHIPLK